MKFAFFGTPDIAVTALATMSARGLTPSLVVTNPDAPVGRKHIITPPPVKVWAEQNSIEVIQPTTLKDPSILTPLTDTDWDLFVVFAYGKLIPAWMLNTPKYGTINAHPSLLPKLRGASPIRSTLLSDMSACGVSIIQMDAELGHGPILMQTPYLLPSPIPGQDLDYILANLCGELLADAVELLPTRQLDMRAQNDTEATFCTKITKYMAQITIDPLHLPTGDEALAVYRKICAFDGWPGTFFFYQGVRIKITATNFDPLTNTLTITRIIPEGKKEMAWEQYFPKK